ncbi:MAG: 3-oxoacyl-[acyl-carrier-protein] reductase [Elusimicrobia bacterium CG_4_10_14_0_2_um_filter_56_8]|nr:MAG: 3-oxoacyl-[acyl-carrier-protein] reductase [Elusimicrobia bacterium CG1_02_56_21]PJA16565.1 MAG: 3-oxoacyl-[acyl-carrier-protein] reductase [Elusimicrobia bacterium CG_4_10_14_0_2_um_filter_56_8]
MKRLEGKTAVITGAARGIGLEIAAAFAAEGASVTIADLSLQDSEAAAADIAARTGAGTLGLALDVSKEADCEKAVADTVAAFGKVDILVNNAGITKDGLVLRMKETDFDSVISVNLKGAFLMSKAVSKFMLKARSGRIVNISSIVGLTGQAGQANYSASKAGLIGLTKSLAREFAPRQVLVNAVAPGFIRTRMTEDLKDEAKAKISELIPLGRIGEPGDVAKAALFLAGGDSVYITGQVLSVNGGLYM